MRGCILVVDDEKSIVDILKFNLENADYSVICAYDGREALSCAREAEPDLILLDVMLPYIDGFEVCRTLRSQGRNVPIIMITAREDETDKVLGLELGADDYITKPFSMRELLARVNANIRRAVVSEPPILTENSENIFRFRELLIDYQRHMVSKGGAAVELTAREYELIKFLASKPGVVVSRQELMSEVWKYDYYGDLRAVDVAVRRLREKLETNPAEPEYVITKRGVGYYFNEN
ncbi:MAG: response regulator transcription factor [Oscillospiraceae bacterium]|jgi:two-component system response regulator VicR|nr:response regulator transcription factor [Oscillospiraceae bacterium]